MFKESVSETPMHFPSSKSNSKSIEKFASEAMINTNEAKGRYSQSRKEEDRRMKLNPDGEQPTPINQV